MKYIALLICLLFSCNDKSQHTTVTSLKVAGNTESVQDDSMVKFHFPECPKSTEIIQVLMKQNCVEGFAHYDLSACVVECRVYKECEPRELKVCPETFLPAFSSSDCRWKCEKVSKLKQH